MPTSDSGPVPGQGKRNQRATGRAAATSWCWAWPCWWARPWADLRLQALRSSKGSAYAPVSHYRRPARSLPPGRAV